MALSSESSLVCLVPKGALGGATEVTLSSVRTKCQGDLGTGRGGQGGACLSGSKKGVVGTRPGVLKDGNGKESAGLAAVQSLRL